jgi:Fe-S-cluster containining protein
MVIDPSVIARWREAAASGDAQATIDRLRAAIAEEVRRRRPLCVSSGRCCGFEAHGHRLYLTGLETAWTWSRLDRRPTVTEVESAMSRGSCPFLAGGCSVHGVRPPGCRIYFCDRDPAGWQSALAERCHHEIKALHDRLDVPYRYAEWRSLLMGFAAADVAS